MIILGEVGQVGERDIIVRRHDNGQLLRMDTLAPAYDPLQYPLLFPYGDDGWTTGISQQGSERRVTMRQFYAYRLQNRLNQMVTFYLSGRLFQQYIVDMAAKVEQNELNYLSHNQQRIRAELYQGLCNLVADDEAPRGLMPGVVLCYQRRTQAHHVL